MRRCGSAWLVPLDKTFSLCFRRRCGSAWPVPPAATPAPSQRESVGSARETGSSPTVSHLIILDQGCGSAFIFPPGSRSWREKFRNNNNLNENGSWYPFIGYDGGQSQQTLHKIIFTKFKVAPQFCQAGSVFAKKMRIHSPVSEKLFIAKNINLQHKFPKFMWSFPFHGTNRKSRCENIPNLLVLLS